MIELINPLTGTITLVTDERLEEYLEAGYNPVSIYQPEQKPVEPVKEEVKAKVKKATSKKKG